MPQAGRCLHCVCTLGDRSLGESCGGAYPCLHHFLACLVLICMSLQLAL